VIAEQTSAPPIATAPEIQTFMNRADQPASGILSITNSSTKTFGTLPVGGSGAGGSGSVIYRITDKNSSKPKVTAGSKNISMRQGFYSTQQKDCNTWVNPFTNTALSTSTLASASASDGLKSKKVGLSNATGSIFMNRSPRTITYEKSMNRKMRNANGELELRI